MVLVFSGAVKAVHLLTVELEFKDVLTNLVNQDVASAVQKLSRFYMQERKSPSDVRNGLPRRNFGLKEPSMPRRIYDYASVNKMPPLVLYFTLILLLGRHFKYSPRSKKDHSQLPNASRE